MPRLCRLLLYLTVAATVCAGVGAPAARAATSSAPAADAAIAIAQADPAAASVRAGSRPRAFRVQGDQWQVRWFRAGNAVLEIDVDVARRKVLAVWRGAAADFPMARGYPGWFGAHVTALWVWLPLSVAFLIPFVDPRNLRRRLHFDLLAVLSLSVSLAFFDHGRTALSVPLAYPPLLYLLYRSLRGLRGSVADGPLVPLLGPRALLVGLLVLVALRAGLNLGDTGPRDYVGWGPLESNVVDVGYAGVAGADRIEHGQPLYSAGGGHLDTYGPVNYLAYVPFELVWPFKGVWDELPAAHAAALTFDLAVIVLLLVLGTRIRPGPEGRRLGLALAYAWAACPWTAYVLASNTNDALVAAGVAATLVAWHVPFVRGVVLGAAAAVKFAPAALLPLAMAGRSTRPALLALAGFALVVVCTTLPFIPDGGLREVYDATIGYQLGTSSPFSIWGRWPDIAWLHTLVKAGVAVVALGSAAVVARRGSGAVEAAAAAAAVLIALELAAMHWIYFYVAWILAPLLVVVFAPHAGSPVQAYRPRRPTKAGAANQAT